MDRIKLLENLFVILDKKERLVFLFGALDGILSKGGSLSEIRHLNEVAKSVILDLPYPGGKKIRRVNDD